MIRDHMIFVPLPCCSFLERFAIYSREQQQVQTDAHGSDLLSYVQMQRNLR